MKAFEGLLGCCLIASMLALPAHAENTIKPGVLTVGTDSSYAPMATKTPDSGKLIGVDVDLATAIARRLNLQIEFVDAHFAQMTPALQTGRIDMVMAGMSDRPARREVANFIDYARSGAQFFTLKEKAVQFKGIGDLCGKTVAYNRGAQWNERVEVWSKANCLDKGRPAVALLGAASPPDARTQLATGRADAVVQGSETIGYLQTLEPGKYEKLGVVFADYLVGAAFLKGNARSDALMSQVQAVLGAMQADGEYDKIMARYGVGDNMHKPLTVNAGT